MTITQNSKAITITDNKLKTTTQSSNTVELQSNQFNVIRTIDDESYVRYKSLVDNTTALKHEKDVLEAKVDNNYSTLSNETQVLSTNLASETYLATTLSSTFNSAKNGARDEAKAYSDTQISSEAFTRASETEALTLRADTLESSLNTKDTATNARIDTETKTRVTADSALSTRIDTMESSFGTDISSTKASITDINKTIATNDQAYAERSMTLESGFRKGLDDVANTFQASTAVLDTTALANATNNAALAQLITDMSTNFTAQNNTLQTNITNEETSRTTADVSLNTTINSKVATLTNATNDINVRIDTEETTRVTKDNALGKRLMTMNSAFVMDNINAVAEIGRVDKTVANESEARATAIEVLTASLGDTNAKLENTSTVVAGYFNVTDGTNPKIGNIKFEKGVQYQYFGGLLGWVRNDESASKEVAQAKIDLTTAYQNYTDVYNEATTDGKITQAEQNAIDAAQKNIDTAKQSLIDNEIGDVAGYVATAKSLSTDSKGVVTGWQYGTNSANVNKFIVGADDFEIRHSNLSSVLVNGDGLYFKKKNGETSKYLQFLHTYQNHTNNTPISLSNLTRVPSVLMGIATMPTFKADYKNQDQSFTFDVVDVNNNIALDGTYSFTPLANLHLASSVFSETLNGVFTDSPNDTLYSGSKQLTTNVNPATFYFSIKSSKPTTTASTYQKRKCTVTLQTSTNNTTWSDTNTSTIVSFGTSLGSLSSSITHNIQISSGYYVRLKFVYADDNGTFTTGSTGYWDNKTISTTVQGGFNGGSGYSFGATGCSGIERLLSPIQGDYYYDTNSAKQFYFCDNPKSANTIKNEAGYSTYSITSFTIKNPQKISNFGLGAAAIMHRVYCYPFNSPVLTSSDPTTFDSLFYAGAYLNSNRSTEIAFGTASITFNVSIKKWITNTQSAGTYNTGSNFTISAKALSAIELASGTMNIIVVE